MDGQAGRELTPDELLFIVRVQHEAIGILLDQLAEAQSRIGEVARDEWENGRLAAYREAAEWGAHLRELIRASADHLTPYTERRARERQWARPKAGDYTGRLSAAEYFGTDAPAPAVERLRAA